MLYNYTEAIVMQYLSVVLDEYKSINPNICTCERCRQDIMAIALNNLPPRYVVTETGKIITQISCEQFGSKTQVITQILKAIKIVCKNPKH